MATTALRLVPLLGSWRFPIARGQADAAHTRRLRYLGVDAASLADTGLTREQATGETAWRPELPFFFQPGFGRRD
jgi:hypothetical protein